MRKIDKKKLVQINDDLWSLIVRTRDNFTCQICSTKSNHLEAHHIIGRDNKATRWDINNGITLCYYHHRFYIHGGKMTEEQRIELYKSILGDEYDRLKEKSNKSVKFNIEFCRQECKRLLDYCTAHHIDTSKVPQYIKDWCKNDDL